MVYTMENLNSDIEEISAVQEQENKIKQEINSHIASHTSTINEMNNKVNALQDTTISAQDRIAKQAKTTAGIVRNIVYGFGCDTRAIANEFEWAQPISRFVIRDGVIYSVRGSSEIVVNPKYLFMSEEELTPLIEKSIDQHYRQVAEKIIKKSEDEIARLQDEIKKQRAFLDDPTPATEQIIAAVRQRFENRPSPDVK